MNRRRVLAILGGGSITLTGALSWYVLRESDTFLPDGMAVETLHYQGNVFSKPRFNPNAETGYYTLIERRTTVENEVTDDDPVQEFVADISFDESYLIIVRHDMQPNPDLVLESIERTIEGLHLEVVADHPRFAGVDDALTSHSLLIHVTDRDEQIPESVTVAVESYN